jgi:iron complex transport system substrate-binding protein
MRNRLVILLALVLTCFGYIGCNKRQKSAHTNTSTPISSMSIGYAEGFSIDYFDSYTRIRIYNPWNKGSFLKTYYLVDDKKTKTPANGIKIKVPLSTIIVNSCSHLEFINLLQETGSINGMSSPERVYNATIKKRFEDGKIENIGDAFAMNIEKIILKRPDAIMVTGYNQMDDTNTRLESTKIPVIVNIEWMEPTSLGRAEWIKFVAAFYKKERMADSIFNKVEANYRELLALANTVKDRPSIASGNSFKGTWYLPGGNSFMGKLYQDAGGNYVFASNSNTGSLPLSFEVALKELRNCDIWLGSNANSLSELALLDSRLTLFDAYKNKKVFNYNKRATPSGGNDYWESAIARPDILLKDLIKVLHPTLLPDYDLFYIHQLE